MQSGFSCFALVDSIVYVAMKWSGNGKFIVFVKYEQQEGLCGYVLFRKCLFALTKSGN
jgi:hypothetical protein